VGEREYACSAENLSRSGVLLVGHFPPAGADEVSVSIRSAAGDVRVELLGQIVYARYETGDADSRVGLLFEGLPPDQTTKLDALVSRVVEGRAPAALEELTAGASPEVVRAALRKVPLPHRVALASRAEIREREWLRLDSDPTVLEALARNPKLLLPEVKCLLRRSDLLPSTLNVIADDPRWFGDEETKMMICTHLKVTFATAERVVQRLNDLAIDRLVRRPGLQPAVKHRLMHRLSLKHRGGS